MAGNRDYDKFLGLSQTDQRVLLYSILCATHDGRNPVNFEKLASELGYAVSSAKVMYASARRKLIKATGIDPGRKPYSRSTAPVSPGAATGITDAGLATSDADADPAAPDPSAAADKGEAPKKPCKVRRTVYPRKRKTCELDEGHEDDEDVGAGTAVAEA